MKATEQTALVLEPQSTAALAQPTPMHLLEMAMQTGSLDMVREFMQLRREWEADEARKAFVQSFAAFKSEAVVIAKNISVTAGPLSGKKYADLFSVVSAITPALSKHGLSLSWKLTKDDQNWLEVTCTVRHILGHSESVSMGGPPDTGGAKNAIQARASAKTYLERYTALAITGMAASDTDHDGRPGEQAGMDDSKFQEWYDHIASSSTEQELQSRYLEALGIAKDLRDQKAMAAFDKAKRECWTRLKGGKR